MLSADEILAQAPMSKLGFKVAFICLGCKWWASHWDKCKLDAQKILCCAACGAPCRELPLEALVEGTREDNPEHFEAFLACHSDNWTGEYANEAHQQESP